MTRILLDKKGRVIKNVDGIGAINEPNLIPENIKKDINILGVTGNYEIIPQEKTITPSTEAQVITPDEGYTCLSKVNVEPVTSAIDSNITAENIKKDVSILGVVGSLESGGSADSYELLEGDITFTDFTHYMNFEVPRQPKAWIVNLKANSFNGLSGRITSFSSYTPINWSDKNTESTYYSSSSKHEVFGVHNFVWDNGIFECTLYTNNNTARYKGTYHYKIFY